MSLAIGTFVSFVVSFRIEYFNIKHNYSKIRINFKQYKIEILYGFIVKNVSIRQLLYGLTLKNE